MFNDVITSKGLDISTYLITIILFLALYSWIIIQVSSFRRIFLPKFSSYEKNIRKIAEGAKECIEIPKKTAIVNSGPKSFYYLDQVLVESLFMQLNEEPKPKEMEMETEKKQKSGFGGKLKFISADLGKEKSEKTKTTYDVTLDITSKYNIIEKNILDSPYINFNVEDFKYDEGKFDELKKMISELKDIENISRIEKAIEEVTKEQISKLALEKIEAISKLSGYVAICAGFYVVVPHEQYIFLSYDHPANKYTDEKKAFIEIKCNVKHLTDLGKSSFIGDNEIKIICFGKIINWNSENNALTIYPIAIY